MFIGFVVMGVGVMLATMAFGGGGGAARVGRVVCMEDGVRVLTPGVAATADGIHLQVANVGQDRHYQVVSEADPRAPATGGVLPGDGVVDLVLTLPPGEAEFTCLRAGTGEPLVARFDVLDPSDDWVPVSLACADPASGVFETDHAVEPFDETARRAVSGLRRSDVLVKPGYSGTAWHGELHVVIREDRVVGRIARVLNHGTWNLSVDACAGSGLTKGAVAETGAA